MRKYIFLLPLLPLAITAQELNKEIVIDRDIVPEQRAANRPTVFPSLVIPTTGKVDLRMEESTSKAQLSPIVTPFDAATNGEAFPLTPWRGYLDAGYFPTADFGISAGYAIVDKATAHLGAWLQANNNSYKENSDADFRYRTTDVALGIDFAQKFGKFNRLRISTDLGYSNWNNPNPLIDGQSLSLSYIPGVYDRRSNLRWRLNAAFDGRINYSFTYGFNLGGGIFNNLKQSDKDRNYIPNTGAASNSDVEIAGMTNQSNINFGAWLRGNVTDKTLLGIKAEGQFLHFSSMLTPTQIMDDFSHSFWAAKESGKTIGVVNVTPAAEFDGGGFYGKLGAKFGFSANSGKTLHVAPDVLLGVNPDDRFGAWLKFGGGVQANTLERMMDISRYADPRVAYNLSNVAFTGQLGLRVGPFHGASLTLTLDYASANNWLMPLQYSITRYYAPDPRFTDSTANIPGDGFNTFAPEDLRSWKFGARFDWSYRKMFDLQLDYETTLSSDINHSWLYWADRARHVLGAQVTLHPGEFAEALTKVKPLSIDVALSARLNRSQGTLTSGSLDYINDQDYTTSEGSINPMVYSLGDNINLSAGASWRFTPRFSIFARFNNLLGRHDATIFDIPMPGLTGLFGLTYKF